MERTFVFSTRNNAGELTVYMRSDDKYGKQPNDLGWKMIRMISKITYMTRLIF